MVRHQGCFDDDGKCGPLLCFGPLASRLRALMPLRIFDGMVDSALLQLPLGSHPLHISRPACADPARSRLFSASPAGFERERVIWMRRGRNEGERESETRLDERNERPPASRTGSCSELLSFFLSARSIHSPSFLSRPLHPYNANANPQSNQQLPTRGSARGRETSPAASPSSTSYSPPSRARLSGRPSRPPRSTLAGQFPSELGRHALHGLRDRRRQVPGQRLQPDRAQDL